MASYFEIDRFKIEVIKPEPTADVRFFSQRQLHALGTPAAHAELARRAEIVQSREEA